MTQTWYLDNNPRHIKLYGVRLDGSVVELFDKVLTDWNNSNIRGWDVNLADEGFFGVRLAVITNKGYEEGGNYHTAIGWLKVRGVPRDPLPANAVTHNGEVVTYNGEIITRG